MCIYLSLYLLVRIMHGVYNAKLETGYSSDAVVFPNCNTTL